MTALLQRAEAAVVTALLWLLGRLSPAAASNLGGGVARLIGPWLPVSRVAHRHLCLAMPELDAAARRRIVRGAWENLGRTAGELPHIASLRQDTQSGPGWEMIGEEHLKALAAKGGPAIFFSGHLANWEMLLPAAAAYGMVVSGMYRGAKNPLVDRILIGLRHRALGREVPMFAKGAAGARAALAHVSRGGFLAMLMDQKMNDGIPARFFGRDAMTAPALAALALRLRCPVIPGHVERGGMLEAGCRRCNGSAHRLQRRAWPASAPSGSGPNHGVQALRRGDAGQISREKGRQA